MLETLTVWTGSLAALLWSWPALVLLVGTGIYLTLRLRALQLRHVGHAVAVLRGRHTGADEPGEVSHFQALATGLSAAVGTGNIAGVATAISFGGPGAVFWMWITAVVGMATKYASCTLAVHYREIDAQGRVAGGPMYTLKNGLHMPRLGAAFALFTLIASFGIGNMVQANSVVDGLRYVVPPVAEHRVWIGLLMAAGVGLVIVGGIRSIARVASVIVPVMAVAYCLAALAVLVMHATEIPAALGLIFNHALNPAAAGGGAIGAAIQYGVARGVFSNEAGLGSSPIAHAAASTREPVRQGLVAMLEPLIDTLVICTLTALVIVISGFWGEARPEGLAGAALSAHAFSDTLGGAGAWVVGLGLTFFAFSTMIAWSYYGDRCAHYLFGPRAVLPYRLLYLVAIVIGASTSLQLVWNFADVANIFMALPNLLSVVLLSGVVVTLTRDYFARQQGVRA